MKVNGNILLSAPFQGSEPYSTIMQGREVLLQKSGSTNEEEQTNTKHVPHPEKRAGSAS